MEWCPLPLDDGSGDGEALLLHLILKVEDSGLVLIFLECEGVDGATASPRHQTLFLEGSGGAKLLLLLEVEGEGGRVPPSSP